MSIILILILILLIGIMYRKYTEAYNPQSALGFLIALPPIFLWYNARYAKWIVMFGFIMLLISGYFFVTDVQDVPNSGIGGGILNMLGATLNLIVIFISIVFIVGGLASWGLSRGILNLLVPESLRRLNATVSYRAAPAKVVPKQV